MNFYLVSKKKPLSVDKGFTITVKFVIVALSEAESIIANLSSFPSKFCIQIKKIGLEADELLKLNVRAWLTLQT